MTDESSETIALLKRYTDAYVLARVMVGIGNTIKIVGIILAVLIFVSAFGIGILFENSSRGTGEGVVIFSLVGFVSALFVGSIFYIVGIVVSAQGQILKASLDSAVNGSPFLANELKSQIMSLGSSSKKWLPKAPQEFVESKSPQPNEQMTAEQIETLKSRRRANHQCEECGAWLGLLEDIKGIKRCRKHR